MNIDIKNISEQILYNHSFEYKTFDEAKDKLQFGNYYYEYDRLSLCYYCHNLPIDMYHSLSKQLSEIYNTNKQEYKLRNEYKSLFYYYNLSGTNKWVINKHERPDFILQCKTKKIGIEITELTIPIIKKTSHINNLIQSETSIDNAKEIISKKYKEKTVNEFEYSIIGNHVVAYPPKINLDHALNNIREQIIHKYEIYKKNLQDFDEFIILCDFIAYPFANSKKDVEDIISYIVSLYKFEHNFKIAVLYYENGINLYEYLIKK